MIIRKWRKQAQSRRTRFRMGIILCERIHAKLTNSGFHYNGWHGNGKAFPNSYDPLVSDCLRSEAGSFLIRPVLWSINSPPWHRPCQLNSCWANNECELYLTCSFGLTDQRQILWKYLMECDSGPVQSLASDIPRYYIQLIEAFFRSQQHFLRVAFGKNPPNGNEYRMSYSEMALLACEHFDEFRGIILFWMSFEISCTERIRYASFVKNRCDSYNCKHFLPDITWIAVVSK